MFMVWYYFVWKLKEMTAHQCYCYDKNTEDNIFKSENGILSHVEKYDIFNADRRYSNPLVVLKCSTQMYQVHQPYTMETLLLKHTTTN